MSEEHSGESPRILKTVSRALQVVRALEELDGATVTEVADHLDVSKSAAYNYLMTLEDQRLVVKEGNDYSLSLQFLMLGEYVRNQNVLYDTGKGEIERLAEETGEYAHLATIQHGLSVNLYKVKGEKAVGSDYQTSKLQKPDYLHFSATGKSMLAYLPRERVEEILDRYGLARKTENTITDREELFDELERIRERGYAYNDEEEIEGLQAIGAPIRDREGSVLGALSVSGPLRRMNDPDYHDTIVETVTNAANVIEVNINMAETDDDLPDFA
ncbi:MULTISPECIES: IclR family transcriptional regulator [Halorussus]|uniref:IclR family transcriptional regulator n=1 Tax=Halorussus TaxID=1070314 RepID=UPI00209FB351|nr:IclR family transcriptional regulator [Halorussus vallis]USZ77469.1 IclR family transcriptional regulator [Halorussus vallis]